MPPAPRRADWRKRICVAQGGPQQRPTIRGLAISVAEVLQSLATGVPAEELLRQHPDLRADDIAACLAYGAELAGVGTSVNGLAVPVTDPPAPTSERRVEPMDVPLPGWLAQANRWINEHYALALFYLMAAASLVVHLMYYGLWRQRIFAVETVSSPAILGVVLPLVVVALIAVAKAKFWAFAVTSVPLALVALLGHLFELPASGGLFPLLTAIFLLGTLVGLAVTNWRLTLVVVIPLLLVLAIAGGIIDQSPQPFIAGTAHGLMLGGICRLAAWALQRELAWAALGTLAGAYTGLIVADLYGPRLFGWLGELGRQASFSLISLYAELLTAYLGAVAAALLGKRVGKGAA
jgi:uncharacterized protein (DUF433 family)